MDREYATVGVRAEDRMMGKTRRQFLVRAAQAGLGAAMLPVAHGYGQSTRARAARVFSGAESLKVHAAAKNLLYGCAVDTALLRRDAGYAELVRSQSSMVVAENAMKWGPMRPAIDQFNFAEADEFVGFAERYAMKVRGHNLCWHRQLPAWFAAEATTANARDLLREHIQRVADRYAGRMHSWDVVNEAVRVEDGRSDGLRESPWLELAGEGYLELAFRSAREADPRALLTYNDYGIEAEDKASSAKRAAVLMLLRRMKARRVPLDAVGVQSHLEAGQVYGSGLREFMAAVREMGLQIFLTEMDVNDRTLPAEVATRDAAVGALYGSYLDLALAENAVRAVLTWGITDRRTWLNSEEARADKAAERCLPFDAEDQPVEAFFAMRKAFDRRRV